MSEHELHCDCRIELLKVVEERDDAKRQAVVLSADLRRTNLAAEKAEIRAAQCRDARDEAMLALGRHEGELDLLALELNAPNWPVAVNLLRQFGLKLPEVGRTTVSGAVEAAANELAKASVVAGCCPGCQIRCDRILKFAECNDMPHVARCVLEALREAGWRIVRTEPVCCEKCEATNGVRVAEEWTPDGN